MAMLRDEKGAALVTALMLTMLALVISMTLLYSVMTGTRISASQKRYRSALAAAHGGVELLTQEIIPQLFQPAMTETTLVGAFKSIDIALPQYGCLQQKLDHFTAEWGGACSAAQSSADPEQSPDVTFRLRSTGTDGGFRISTKIVDTIPGNSDKGGLDYLDTGMSVTGKDEVVHPQHVPSIYSLSVQGVRDAAGSREKARLSVLYAY
jgi:hypothetical protein